MSHLLQPLKSPSLQRWACFQRRRASTNALGLFLTAPALQAQAFERFRNDVHE